jgi:hypothetical protein
MAENREESKVEDEDWSGSNRNRKRLGSKLLSQEREI